MTKVLIADDQALVRVGLRKILESDAEMTVDLPFLSLVGVGL